MSILISWLGPLRAICMAIDGIAFSLLDNAYNIVIELSSARILEHDAVKKIMGNLYILFGVVAFFRLALVLVNSILDPEKLNEKGKGLSNIFFRVVGMIIILGVTPFIFELSYNVQEAIISPNKEKNVIFSLILGDNDNIGGYDKDGYNAGKALQNVVLSSLITIDHRYLVKDGEVCTIDDNGEYKDSSGNVVSDVNSSCGFVPLTCVPEPDGKTCRMQGGYIYDEDVCGWKNCQNAVDKYNKMYVDEDMEPSSLAGSAGVSTKLGEDDAKEEVYVYDYMFIVTSIAGVAMTWIILSFAIDIAVRMFELIVLEVLSPLFIATFVDPKSAQSGPFKNWLSAVGKSYASLYIKLVILALMTLLIMIVNQAEVFNTMRGDIRGFAKIFIIFGLLIFAKKAPKWIGDMIGIKTDGMGLYTPGKLKDAMLGGAMMAGAAKGLAGTSLAAGKNLASIARQNRNARKELTGHSSKRGAKRALRVGEDDKAYRNSIYRANRAQGMKAADAKRAADAALAKRNEDIKALNKISGTKANAAQLGSALFNAAGSFNAAAKSDKLTGALKVGNERGKEFKNSRGLQGDSIFDNVKTKINSWGTSIEDIAFGDEGARHERAEQLKKEKARKTNHTKEALAEYGDKLYDGMGKFSDSITTGDGTVARNIEDAKAIYAASKLKDVDKSDIKYIKDANGQMILSINGDTNTSAYRDIAQNALSGAGKVDFMDKYNKTQGNSINEYQSNYQELTNLAQSIAPMQKLMNDAVSKMNNAFKNINFGSLEGKIDLSASGNLKIDAGTVNGEFNSSNIGELTEQLKKSTNPADKELYDLLTTNDSFKDLLENMSQKDTYASSIASQESTMQELQARNTQLKVIVDGVKDRYDKETGLLKRDANGNIEQDYTASTVAGAASVVARDKDSIGEIVEVTKKQLQKSEGKKE